MGIYPGTGQADRLIALSRHPHNWVIRYQRYGMGALES